VFGEHHAQIGCVLLDLTMPEMDGLETMQPFVPSIPKPDCSVKRYSEQTVAVASAGTTHTFCCRSHSSRTI